MSLVDPVFVVPGDVPAQLGTSPQLQRLQDRGRVVVHDTLPADDEEKVARVAEADVLLHSRGKVTWREPVLRRLPHLKLIATCSIGTDSVDVDVCRELGITVCNVPGRTAGLVAEHALALLLGTARRLAWRTAEVKAGRWAFRMDTSLRGRTLGIVGTGNIGCAFAKLAKAIGMNVVAWTFHPDEAKAEACGFRYVGFDELLETSDAVSVHCRLSDDSRGLIGRDEIARLKPGCLLVNTARGPVVDTAALVDALNSGHLGGAGIDVFDEEPLPADHPLLSCEQVVLTPHSADQMPEGAELLNTGCIDNVLAFLSGQPTNVVT